MCAERFDTASDHPFYNDSQLLACFMACRVRMCLVHAQTLQECTKTDAPDGLVLGLKDLCALAVLLSLTQGDL